MKGFELGRRETRDFVPAVVPQFIRNAEFFAKPDDTLGLRVAEVMDREHECPVDAVSCAGRAEEPNSAVMKAEVISSTMRRETLSSETRRQLGRRATIWEADTITDGQLEK
jgi:hypothetical protein